MALRPAGRLAALTQRRRAGDPRLALVRIGLGRGSLGSAVEDFTGLFCGADDALADEVEEPGDVLQAGGSRGVRAEEGNALPCGLDELVVGPGAGDRGLVEELVIDDVAVTAAFVAFAADQALTAPASTR